MSRGKLLLYSVPLVLFLLLGYFFARALHSDPSLLPSTRVDHQVPAFNLNTLAEPEQQITEQMIKGPLLLNVWATWCPSCQLEHPMLIQLAENGIRIIGLNYKDERMAAQKYLDIHGNPFEFNIYDTKGDLGLDLGVYGAPETFLIDSDGVIRYRHVGVISPEVWRETLWPKWQAMGGTHSPVPDVEKS
ncbi:MAG: DsbE family thiol:disulfide interchange protein [Ketobacter sp.]|nr:MAG: DsbE family thiol:disulfide interchange protein [Ketobacter sp.]